MTARTLANWVALGCPVTVQPDGRKAYLLSPTTSIALASGRVVLSDQPFGSTNKAMAEHKIFPVPIDRVDLDLSLIPA